MQHRRLHPTTPGDFDPATAAFPTLPGRATTTQPTFAISPTTSHPLHCRDEPAFLCNGSRTDQLAVPMQPTEVTRDRTGQLLRREGRVAGRWFRCRLTKLDHEARPANLRQPAWRIKLARTPGTTKGSDLHRQTTAQTPPFESRRLLPKYQIEHSAGPRHPSAPIDGSRFRPPDRASRSPDRAARMLRNSVAGQALMYP